MRRPSNFELRASAFCIKSEMRSSRLDSLRSKTVDNAVRITWPAFLLLVLPGCSGEAVQTAEVEGTILWNKKPLKNVEVQFLPDVEMQTRGPRSTAITDEQGRYTLYFDDDQPGAVVGHHLIVLNEIDEDMPRSRKGEGRSPGARGASNRQPASHMRIPDKYKIARTTPLKQQVQAGPQVINFDLP